MLVNNAGLVGLDRRRNDAGLELTFAVNDFAMFRLILGLLSTLRATAAASGASDGTVASARIVNISSDTYWIAKIDFADLQLERDYNLMKSYGQSKRASLYFTLELARRALGSGVTVKTVDPGPVASNFRADNSGLAYRLFWPVIRGFFRVHPAPRGQRSG